MTIIVKPKDDIKEPDYSFYNAAATNDQSDAGQINSTYSKTTQCLWLTMASQERACLSPGMLIDLDANLRSYQQSHPNTKAIVLASADPHIFSYGSDLNYVRSLIIKYDKETLFNYVKLNLDVIFKFASQFQPLRIAQVTGAAFNGGFEAALASDVIIAERQATFGFPDLEQKLFPCLGTSFYLTRRIGTSAAKNILSSATIYSADELAELGIVDVVVDSGCSTNAVINYISHHQKHNASNNSLKQIAERINQTPYSKLLDNCNEWVEQVMTLSGHELRQIERIVKHQVSAY